MMRVQKSPARLFYDFDVEAHVPTDHMLHEIDRFLDVGNIRQQLKPFYSHLSRPSIDPELIVRILVIGYVLGIRSERRLCEEVHLNLAYRWFSRLGLDQKVQDHCTFSRYLHGKCRDGDQLHSVFEATVARCISEGLAGAMRCKRRIHRRRHCSIPPKTRKAMTQDCRNEDNDMI